VAARSSGSLPAGVGPAETLAIAGWSGRLNALQLHFDPNDRYNLCRAFSAVSSSSSRTSARDQSQVGRYLTGSSVTQSRLGLRVHGLLKVPMQFVIPLDRSPDLRLYLFTASPLWFDPLARARLEAVQSDGLPFDRKPRHHDRRASAQEDLAAGWRLGGEGISGGGGSGRVGPASQQQHTELRTEVVGLSASRTEGVDERHQLRFLTYVLSTADRMDRARLRLRVAASRTPTSAELNALTSTTVIDVAKRIRRDRRAPERSLDVASHHPRLGGVRRGLRESAKPPGLARRSGERAGLALTTARSSESS